MNKILKFLLTIIVIIPVIAQQQPAVKVPITIDDGAGASKTLHFGLDPNATDSLDVQFGEYDLPPYPPMGAFDTRFLLPENNFSGTLSSWDDYRQADLPFTGQKEHRIRSQPAFGTVINITWNFPHNTVTAVLQDIITGTFINVNLADSGTYTVTNPNVFDKLKLLVNYVNIIPVELTSFSASVVDNKVILNWSTATELNNKNFEIQRKTENSDWKTLDYVAGYGTTTEPHNYTFVDNTVSTNTKYFYRLRQNDFDGKFRFSDVIEINISSPKDYSLEQNYPNPFNPSTNISFSLPNSSFVKLIIYNQLGEVVDQLVNQQLDAGTYIYKWNADSQSTGIYLYELQADGYKQTKKMSFLK